MLLSLDVAVVSSMEQMQAGWDWGQRTKAGCQAQGLRPDPGMKMVVSSRVLWGDGSSSAHPSLVLRFLWAPRMTLPYPHEVGQGHILNNGLAWK